MLIANSCVLSTVVRRQEAFMGSSQDDSEVGKESCNRSDTETIDISERRAEQEVD